MTGSALVLAILLTACLLVGCGRRSSETARPGNTKPPEGAVNPFVDQANVDRTICVPGWAAMLRPPASFTSKLKVSQIHERGLADRRPADYEEDHLVPLELGGAPRDPHNLWPQAIDQARQKDEAENRLHRAVCGHSMTLEGAQRAIRDPKEWHG